METCHAIDEKSDRQNAGDWHELRLRIEAATKLNVPAVVGVPVTLANSVLGGNLAALPAGMTVSDLNSIVDSINNDFDGGTTNKGYLQ